MVDALTLRARRLGNELPVNLDRVTEARARVLDRCELAIGDFATGIGGMRSLGERAAAIAERPIATTILCCRPGCREVDAE